MHDHLGDEKAKELTPQFWIDETFVNCW
jgi:hypothetical protein